MKVVMVGTGYVGLVSGVCFADFGHAVVCVDKDASKVNSLKKGEIPIYEPGLDKIVAENMDAGRLLFTTNLQEALVDVDVVFIAVGTPSRRGDGHADLKYVYAATEEIAKSINSFTVIVTKSTVPVGTGDEVENILAKHCSRDFFAVVSNPEFLREGAAIEDFKRPDRIVVGTDDLKAQDIMRELYSPVTKNDTTILFTSRRSSELTKYAANAFLATKISFINEMALLCEKVGSDVQDVAKGIGLDKRIGPKFLNPGPGYGGSCFPKDTLALVKTASQAGANVTIVEAVIEANKRMKQKMADKVIKLCGGNISDLKVAILGLAFKPNTDDMRDAPVLTIIPILQKAGAKISAYDPAAMEEAKKHLIDVEYAEDTYSCVKDADILVFATEWDQFRALNLKEIKSLMKVPRIIDLRNIYSNSIAKELGVEYESVGRPIS